MSTFKDFPTSHIMGTDGLMCEPDWPAAPTSLTPGAGLTEQANYEATLMELAEVDPTTQDHDIVIFRHWSTDWVMHIFVRPGTPCDVVQADIRSRLAKVSVLDKALWHELAAERQASAKKGA